VVDKLAKATGGRKSTTGRNCWVDLDWAGLSGGGDGDGDGDGGLAPSPWSHLIKGDCHLNCDCQSCLQGPQWIDCFFQSLTKPTITRTCAYNAARSQLDPPVDAISRGGVSESRGGYARVDVGDSTYAHRSDATLLTAAYTRVGDDGVSAVVTRTYACDGARVEAPRAALQETDGVAPGGPPPLISPKAPTSGISTNPSASTRCGK
jgi:hypothetical protein